MRVGISVCLGLTLLMTSHAVAQQAHDLLCGTESELPLWIVRVEVIDADSHMPVSNARLRLSDSQGRLTTWWTSDDGVGVMVATATTCIPVAGTMEVAADGYQPHSEDIAGYNFYQNQNAQRIHIEGEDQNWPFPDRRMSTQRLMAVIHQHAYVIPSGQGAMNSAEPSCFEYLIPMQRIPGMLPVERRRSDEGSGRREEPRPQYPQPPTPQPAQPTWAAPAAPIAPTGAALLLQNADFAGGLNSWSIANGGDSQHPQTPGSVRWDPTFGGSARMDVSGAPSSILLAQATGEPLSPGDMLFFDISTSGMSSATFAVEVGETNFGGERVQLVEPQDGEHRLVMTLNSPHEPGTLVKLILVTWPGSGTCWVKRVSWAQR